MRLDERTEYRAAVGAAPWSYWARGRRRYYVNGLRAPRFLWLAILRWCS